MVNPVVVIKPELGKILKTNNKLECRSITRLVFKRYMGVLVSKIKKMTNFNVTRKISWLTFYYYAYHATRKFFEHHFHN